VKDYDDRDNSDSSGGRLAKVSTLAPTLTTLINALSGLVEALSHLVPHRQPGYGRSSGYTNGYSGGRQYAQPRQGISGLKLTLLLLAFGLGAWMLPIAAQHVAIGLLIVAVGSWVRRFVPPLGRALKLVGLIGAVIATTLMFI